MTRYRRSPDALSAEVGEDVVALQSVRGFAFGMEGVTASVWQALEKPRTLTEIVKDLQKDYEVEADRAEREVGDLLDQLESEGLIEKVSE